MVGQQVQVVRLGLLFTVSASSTKSEQKLFLNLWSCTLCNGPFQTCSSQVIRLNSSLYETMFLSKLFNLFGEFLKMYAVSLMYAFVNNTSKNNRPTISTFSIQETIWYENDSNHYRPHFHFSNTDLTAVYWAIEIGLHLMSNRLYNFYLFRKTFLFLKSCVLNLFTWRNNIDTSSVTSLTQNIYLHIPPSILLTS